MLTADVPPCYERQNVDGVPNKKVTLKSASFQMFASCLTSRILFVCEHSWLFCQKFYKFDCEDTDSCY